MGSRGLRTQPAHGARMAAGMPAPGQFIADCSSAADYYTNKLLMEHRGKDEQQTAWIKALKVMGAHLCPGGGGQTALCCPATSPTHNTPLSPSRAAAGPHGGAAGLGARQLPHRPEMEPGRRQRAAGGGSAARGRQQRQPCRPAITSARASTSSGGRQGPAAAAPAAPAPGAAAARATGPGSGGACRDFGWVCGPACLPACLAGQLQHPQCALLARGCRSTRRAVVGRGQSKMQCPCLAAGAAAAASGGASMSDVFKELSVKGGSATGGLRKVRCQGRARGGGGGCRVGLGG